jgi:hypothetical protein
MGKLLKVPPSNSKSPASGTGGKAPGMAVLARMDWVSGPWLMTCSQA